MAGLKTAPVETGRAGQIIPVVDLSGGLDLRSSPTLMGADRSQVLNNWALNEPGVLVVRPGYVKFSTQTISTLRATAESRPTGAARIYLNTALPAVNSTAFTLFAWQGGIYRQNDNGTWDSTTPSLSGLSTVNETYWAHDRDLVAVFDGSTNPWKSTNSTTWTIMGIISTAAAATLSSGTAGNLSSAEFEVTYTYKDRDLAYESNASTSLSTVTLSSTGRIDVTVPNSTDPQVDAIVLYARNKTAGETIIRKVSSAARQGAAGAGGNSTYQITSSAWTSNAEQPTTHDRPAIMSFGVVWKNRWWGRDATRKNRIRFTELFLPQAWPSLFYVDIPFTLGDEITAMIPLGDTLIVFGNTVPFLIIGQTSLDFEVRPSLGGQDGALGPRAVERIENGIVHAGPTGVFIFDGTTDRILSYDIDPGWRDLVRNVNNTALAKVALVYHGLRKELRIAVPRLFPTGVDGEWILDLTRTKQGATEAWATTDRTIGGYVHWYGPETVTGNRGRLFSWDSSLAAIFEESTNTDANGSNMTADYTGPGLSLGLRKGRWNNLRGEYQPAAGTFTVEPLIDGVTQGAITIGIGSGNALYGTGLYGTAVYAGSGRRQFYTDLPLAAEGRTLIVKTRYVGKSLFRLFSYDPEIMPETRSRSFTE